jgi:DNA topoisomerase-1
MIAVRVSLHDGGRRIALMSLRSPSTSLETERQPTPLEVDAMEAAEAAGLRYVHDRDPGFARKRAGPKAFRYFDQNGRRITDRKILERLGALKIPPAWTDVWICPRANGHLQVTGRDQRGRKQYLYHAEWRSFRDQTKYGKMISFGEKLPSIRRHLKRDLKRSGLCREKVLATVVSIMDQAHIRVGNDEYARTNDSYGLTTLKHRHVKVTGSKVKFHFRGKSGIVHDICVDDPRVARVVRKCEDLPGQELFAYLDENGELVDVGSSDVNEYLKSIAGEDFTAKDFRTWGGSVVAACCLLGLGPCKTEREQKKFIRQAVLETASKLGNTVSVCRKYYIHPTITETFADGTLFSLGERAFKARGLKRPEAFLLNLLKSASRPRARSVRRPAPTGRSRSS